MHVNSKGIIEDAVQHNMYEFISNMGVKQGDGASPELFLLFFDRVFPYLHEYYTSRGIGKQLRFAYTIASLQLFMLAFADDLVLLAPSPEEL
jgi:hypothetical protein